VSRQLFFITTLALSLLGCSREEELTWKSSDAVNELPSELQLAVRAEIRNYVGTYSNPKLLTDPNVPESTLKLGQTVYQKRCVQCHGVSGDGNGPVAKYLYPKPRDYRKGMFKFTSTPFGSRPQRDDLIRTLKRGIRGTSMPAFNLLPDEEIEAVVDYVLVLSQRGELERQVAAMAEFDEEVDPEMIEGDIVPFVKSLWEQSQSEKIDPFTPQPIFTGAHVAAGKEAFLSRGCAKCHGDDGRGMTEDNLKGSLRDEWGNPTRAADLTSGMLRGGQQPLDIYRRIYGGINGTPMPGFATSLKSEPETIWNLVAYVMHISNRRRAGESPALGPLAPYLPPTENP